jgi:serine/threonine protein kinase/Flp pilus assembly protein TadD
MTASVKSPALSNDADPVLDELLAEFANRLQGGDPVDVEAYAQEHPEYAAALKRLLPAMQILVEFERSVAGGTAHPSGHASHRGLAPGALGDFRIVREIGRGGMGVVYEAEQISLNRRVALKVLPFAAALDAKQLQRFKNEAQAAGCLQHQNIVPVYGIGCERAVHFYAMQFIEGQTLAQVIEQLRQKEPVMRSPLSVERSATQPEQARATEHGLRTTDHAVAALSTERSARGQAFFRTVAQLGMQAAAALAHAHQLGVVHRDIKPANLLVDVRGNLWITDFGLAHCQNHAGLTMTGDLVGTLRYMSPEQALANRGLVDHRTDIYSLGMTLYELLTFRPAVPGNDRQELLRRIAFEEPLAPRRLNKSIPAELETIVLKAIEKRPPDRFASAQQLADDLEHFLKDEPIRAKRPTPWQRLKKWSRRHKPLVWSAAAFATLSLLLLAANGAWLKERWATLEGKVNEAIEEAQRQQREGHWPEALATARHAEQLLAEGRSNAELQQRLHELLADLSMIAEVQGIRLRVTAVTDDHFNTEQADPDYAHAFREYGIDVETLGVEEAAEQLRPRRIAVELAAALDDWASIRKDTRGSRDPSWKNLLGVARAADPDVMRDRVRDALQRLDRKALAEVAASDQSAALPVPTLLLLGSALQSTGAVDKAVTLLRDAQGRHPGDFWINQNLAVYLRQRPSPDWHEVLRFRSAALAARPQSPGAHFNVASTLNSTGAWQEACAAYRQAILLKPDYGMAHFQLGYVLKKNGQAGEAITAWSQACAAYREAIQRKPDHAEAYFWLGRSCQLIAQTDEASAADSGSPRRHWGSVDEAIVAYREAIRLKPDFDRAYCDLGIALSSKGQVDEAIAVLNKAIGLKGEFAGGAYSNLCAVFYSKGQLDEAIAAGKEGVRLAPRSADVHYNLGNALQRKGELDAAITALKEAIRLEPDHAKAQYTLGKAFLRKGQLDAAITASNSAVRLDAKNADAYLNLGVALDQQGKTAPAIDAYNAAIRIQPNHGKAHYNLGGVFLRKEQLDEAIAAYRKAVKLMPDFPEAHCNLGLVLLRHGDFTEALASLERGHNLGSKNKGWPYPSAQWVKDAERMLALERNLSVALRQETQPSGNEWLVFAQLCVLKRLNGSAVRCYEQAFAAQSKLASDRKAPHRYDAARVAARAASGQGDDAATLADKDRARCRKQALDWLQEELSAWRKRLKGATAKEGARGRQVLMDWQREPDLASLRGDPALAKLTQEERNSWQRFWTEVEVLLKQPPAPD